MTVLADLRDLLAKADLPGAGQMRRTKELNDALRNAADDLLAVAETAQAYVAVSKDLPIPSDLVIGPAIQALGKAVARLQRESDG